MIRRTDLRVTAADPPSGASLGSSQCNSQSGFLMSMGEDPQPSPLVTWAVLPALSPSTPSSLNTYC